MARLKTSEIKGAELVFVIKNSKKWPNVEQLANKLNRSVESLKPVVDKINNFKNSTGAKRTNYKAVVSFLTTPVAKTVKPLAKVTKTTKAVAKVAAKAKRK